MSWRNSCQVQPLPVLFNPTAQLLYLSAVRLSHSVARQLRWFHPLS